MYSAEIDLFTMKPLQTAGNLRDRKLQLALMQFFQPENHLCLTSSLSELSFVNLRCPTWSDFP